MKGGIVCSNRGGPMCPRRRRAVGERGQDGLIGDGGFCVNAGVLSMSPLSDGMPFCDCG